MNLIQDQPIMARFGETVYLTSFITPKNPDVLLKFNKLAAGSRAETIWNLWQYVANLPYSRMVEAILQTPSMRIKQPDMWFYPAETMQVEVSNCANRAFLLTSLLKNMGEEGVYCVLGQLEESPGMPIGSHAWVQIPVGGVPYYIETTARDLPGPLVPVGMPYNPFIWFDESSVYVSDNEADQSVIFNGKFVQPGAIDWLGDYLSAKALPLINA